MGAAAESSVGEPRREDIEQAEAELIGDVGADDASGGGAEAPGMGAIHGAANALEIAQSGSEQPLPAPIRSSLEAASGRDLSGVRIHDDPAAGQAAMILGARAFALKQDLYFAPGAYDPNSVEGRRLIAHEVAHTLQPEGPVGAGVTAPGDTVEHEAETFAEAVVGRQREAEQGAADQPTMLDTAAAPRAHETLATTAVAPAHALAATRTRVSRFPGVVKEAFDEDKIRWIDPGDHGQGKVWQQERGYIKNPTATKLSTVVGANGKVGGGFENGKFMYVVDAQGEVWVGKRLGKNMPHPTLVGGKDPQILGAGMVQIEGGKIVKIDNHSGHFRPPRGSLRAAIKSFLRLPKEVFKNFSAESVHFDAVGAESRKAFTSLRMLKLKSFNPTRTINRLRLRYRNDPKFKGKVNAGLKGVGKSGLAIIAALVVDYFLGKWLAEQEAEQIRGSLARLSPEVEAALLKSLESQADTLDMLNESNPDTKIYINIMYRLAWIEAYMAGPGGEMAASEGYGGAEFVSAELSQSALQEELKFESTNSCFGATTKNRRLSVSEEIRVGDLYGDEADNPNGAAAPLRQAAGGSR